MAWIIKELKSVKIMYRPFFVSSIYVAITSTEVKDESCNYVYYGGYIMPTEVCTLKGIRSSNGDTSHLFHCGSIEIEMETYDNKYCSRIPISITNLEGSPDYCTTATITNDYYYSEILFVMNV